MPLMGVSSSGKFHLDHSDIVCTKQNRLRYGDAKGFGRVVVDDELKFRSTYDRHPAV
jgi:hypothetical protein